MPTANTLVLDKKRRTRSTAAPEGHILRPPPWMITHDMQSNAPASFNDRTITARIYTPNIFTTAARSVFSHTMPLKVLFSYVKIKSFLIYGSLVLCKT